MVVATIIQCPGLVVHGSALVERLGPRHQFQSIIRIRQPGIQYPQCLALDERAVDLGTVQSVDDGAT